MDEINEWHILGAGAIGCLFAARLTEADVNCQLVLRDPAGLPQCDIKVEDSAGAHHYKLAASGSDSEAPIARLLLTTKAYDVEAALLSVRHRLGSGSQLLIMVNGMGLVEIAASLLPDVELYAGTTTEGAFRTGQRSIQHAGSGTTRIGSPGKMGSPGSLHEAPWFGDWEGSALECHWEPNIEQALWHKLAINCAINPLTALHRCHNGGLDDSPTLRSIVSSLCDEIAAVSEAAGFCNTARDIHRDALEVIRSTARNKSSMLQDVLAGRRTEIDFITGYLVERADALGIRAVRNRELLERIRNLDC